MIKHSQFVRNFRGYSVYTRTGDKGTSSLFTGERRPKDDAVFDALGNTDELNSVVGVAREYVVNSDNNSVLVDRLSHIQARLLDVGSCVATPLSSGDVKRINRTLFSSSEVDNLEKWIDEMESKLPPLKNFILPSGGLASSHLHLCRSICRRAERSVVPLIRNQQVDNTIGIYINRLSDFFFVAARFSCKNEGKEEIVYKHQKEKEAATVETVAAK